MGKKIDTLKDVMKLVKSKDFEKGLVERQQLIQNCNHTISFLEGIPEDKVKEEFNFCPKCGIQLKNINVYNQTN